MDRIPNLNLTRNRNLDKVFDFSKARFIDSLDLSHNEIESLSDSRVFAASTMFIYLNDNRIKFIHKKSFDYLYDLRELHLENNMLKKISFEFDFIDGEQLITQVFLNGNTGLNNLTGFY
jgi:Leucine-rich repeat (LRR) protein